MRLSECLTQYSRIPFNENKMLSIFFQSLSLIYHSISDFRHFPGSQCFQWDQMIKIYLEFCMKSHFLPSKLLSENCYWLVLRLVRNLPWVWELYFWVEEQSHYFTQSELQRSSQQYLTCFQTGVLFLEWQMTLDEKLEKYWLVTVSL